VETFVGVGGQQHQMLWAEAEGSRPPD
jgi:hypothetical protein